MDQKVLLFILICTLSLVFCIECHTHEAHILSGGHHRCIHDELFEKEARAENGIVHQLKKPARFEPHIEQMLLKKKNSRAVKQETFSPLRIEFRTDYLEGSVESASKRTCYQTGQKYRKGNPSSESVSCSSTVTSDCWGTCTSDLVVTSAMINTVKNVLIPEIKAKFSNLLSTRKLPGFAAWPTGFTTCGAEGGIELPNGLNGVDPELYDTIMFVTLRPTDTGVLGWAINCLAEAQYDRPIAGQLNLSPLIFKSPKLLQLGVILHETTHALGFSSSSFPKFVDENGIRRTGVTSTKQSTFTDSSGTAHSKEIVYLTTPEVLKRTRDYLECQTVDGVPLEEYGGSGTSGSHFEKTFVMNELMVGSVSWFNPTETYAFSQFSLAVLQDSGWYRSNFSQATATVWGSKMGCNFINTRCENWNTNQNAGYYCNSPFLEDGATRINYCTFNYRSKGYCDITTYSSRLNFYEHLPNPNQGGSDDLLNFCPIVYRYENGKCNDVANQAVTGEKFGGNSGCFDSNLSLLGAKKNTQDARCFRYRCNAQAYLEIVVDAPTGDKVYECPKDESYLRIENDAPYGMSGYVVCPKNGYTLLCKTPFDDPTVTGKFPNVGKSGSNPLCDWFGLWCSPSSRVTYSLWVLCLAILTALFLCH